MILWDLLRDEVVQHPYPLLFVTISGAHLYGSPSADSDYDLRGVHVIPAAEAEFFLLLLKRNGYVLEQLEANLLTLNEESERSGAQLSPD